MAHSSTEENYIKAIFKLSGERKALVATNKIAEAMQTTAASTTDMIKRLAEKKLVHYEKYKGAKLSDTGSQIAKKLIRKHRLWEVFLMEKLGFAWDEIHPIAEELEHIPSDELMDRLDKYLGFPKYDPHGDPIPDAEGNIVHREYQPLNELPSKTTCVVVGVRDSSSDFLKYLDSLEISLGSRLKVLDRIEYDGSIMLELEDKSKISVSSQVSKNIFVKKV